MVKIDGFAQKVGRDYRMVKNEWIPVSERLPEVDCPVLACWSNGLIMIMAYEDGTVNPRGSDMYIDMDYFRHLNDIFYKENEDSRVNWRTIPKGWWSVDVEHDEPECYMDGDIVAWMPLPCPSELCER